MPRPLSQLSPLLQLGIAALGASLVALFLRLRRPRLTANVAANPVPSKPADVVAPGAATAAPGDDTASGTELALVGGFDIGARVRLTGLASKPELNNARGCVVGHDNVKDRVNVSLENGRTLQVKPTNLTTAGAIEQLSAVELSSLALADQNAFTKEHAEHLIHLLGQPSQNPIEAGMLLRCCCSVDWHLFALRNARTKKDKMFTFDTPKVHSPPPLPTALGDTCHALGRVKSRKGAPPSCVPRRQTSSTSCAPSTRRRRARRTLCSSCGGPSSSTRSASKG